MEGYSYTKKGSNTALYKILSLLKDHFDTNKMVFDDVDEAILLAGTLAEIHIN